MGRIVASGFIAPCDTPIGQVLNVRDANFKQAMGPSFALEVLLWVTQLLWTP